MQLELDGAEISSASGTRWDCSSLVVLDELIDEQLRAELKALITAPDWSDAATAPPAAKWDRKLVDIEGQPARYSATTTLYMTGTVLAILESWLA
jgi:hypothetical protein